MTTTPQAALLSDDDIHDVCEGIDYTYSPMKFAYAIEAKILAKLQATQAEPVQAGELHDAIMNLQCVPQNMDSEPNQRLAYKVGHRDARHAAAELAAENEARAALSARKP